MRRALPIAIVMLLAVGVVLALRQHGAYHPSLSSESRPGEGSATTSVPGTVLTPRRTEDPVPTITHLTPVGWTWGPSGLVPDATTEREAAQSALRRLARFRAAGAPPVEGVFVKWATLREFNETTGGGGTDAGVADKTGFFVAVDGAFQVSPPDGESTGAPFSHAYILMRPGGDELAVSVTNTTIDRTGFDRVPL